MEEVPGFLRELNTFLVRETKAITVIWDPSSKEKRVFVGEDLILIVPDSREPIDNLIVSSVKNVSDVKSFPTLASVLRESVYHNRFPDYVLAVKEEELLQKKVVELDANIEKLEQLIARTRASITSLREEKAQLLALEGIRPNHNEKV